MAIGSRRVRKYVSMFLALVFLLTIFPTPAYFSATAVEEEIEVSISLENNPQTAGQLTINTTWDSSQFEFVSFTPSSVVNTSNTVVEVKNTQLVNGLAAGQSGYTISLGSAKAASVTDGSIGTYKLKVLATEPGTYIVNVALTKAVYDRADLTTAYASSLKVTGNSVTIAGNAPGGEEDDDDETPADEPLTASVGYGGEKAFANDVYTFTANTGYAVDVIYIDGEPDTSYQGAASAVIDVSEGFDDVVSIVATFAHTINFQPPTNGTLSVSRSINGTSVAVDSGDIVRDGETLYITTTPTNNSYVLDEIVVEGLGFVSAGVYIVLAERGEATPFVSASFKDATPPSNVAHTITLPTGYILYEGHQAGHPITSSVATAKLGDPVTLTAESYVKTFLLENLEFFKTEEPLSAPVPIMTTVNADNKYTFTMPDYDITVKAEFGLSNYIKVDPLLSPFGGISQVGTGAKGTVVTLYINAQAGHQFVSGSFDIFNTKQNKSMFELAPERIEKISDTQYKYTVLNEPVTVTAQFENAPVDNKYIVFSADSPVAASINGEIKSFVPARGGSITFSLLPLEGYEVIGVHSDRGTIISNGNGEYTLNGASEHTVVFIDTKDIWVPADKMIYSASDLIELREEVAAGSDYSGKIVRMGANISLKDANWTSGIGKRVPGSGFYANAFAGTFDGDGYTLTLDGRGLFEHITGGVVKNLITDGNSSTSAVVASSGYGSAIINCKNYATVTNGSGGIASSVTLSEDATYNAQNSMKPQLKEPYIGIFRCANYASVTGVGGGIGTAQRIIKSGNTGEIHNNFSEYSGAIAVALGMVGSTYTSALAPGMIVDRCYNTGNLYSLTQYAAGIYGANVTNSYNSGDILCIAESGVGNPAEPAHINGIIGVFVVKNSFVTGKRAADSLYSKYGISLEAVYMQKYTLDNGTTHLVGSSPNTYTHATILPAAPLSSAFAADGKLAWENAAPLTYGVTFVGGEVTIPDKGTSNSFTLPAGTYTYTFGGSGGSFNLLSDGKIIDLSATVTFDIPEGATVTVTGQNPTVEGGKVYQLYNGSYTYTVSQTGKATLNGEFTVPGESTITIGALPNAVEVTFTLDSGVTLVVKDAAGREVTPVGGVYTLAEGATYSYSASGSGFVSKANVPFEVTAETDTIVVRLDAADVTVTIATTPEAATVVLKDSDGATVAATSGKTYALKSGETYIYTASATNYTDAIGEFEASAGQTVEVTLTQDKVNVTFSVSPNIATVVVKQGDTVVDPASGKTYSLDRGQNYTYTVSATDYTNEAARDVEFTADATKTIYVNLQRQTATVIFTVNPSSANVALHNVSNTSNEAFTKSGNVVTFDIGIGSTYEYTVNADSYTSKTGVFTLTEAGAAFTVELTQSVADTNSETTTINTADYTITAGGTYLIARGLNDALIKVRTTEAVTISGTGIGSGDIHTELEIDCAAGANLTVNDLYVKNGKGETSSGETGAGKHIINFTGGSNTLYLGGMNLFDQDGYIQSAAIHVPSGSSLTMSGNLYMYKRSQGAGIGGDSYEASGTLNFTGGQLYIKGSKTGALIGGDAGAAGQTKPGSSGTNGTITFSGGEVVLVTKAQGAAIGASHLGTCAGAVVISGANVTVISDFNAGVGRGGGNDGAPNGTLTIRSGTFTAIRTANSYYAIGDNSARAINGSSSPAYIDDKLVTSSITNGNGQPVHLFTYDTSKLKSGAIIYPIAKYTESAASTLANFGYDNSNKLFYTYLTEAEQTVTIGSEKFTVKWTGTAFSVDGYVEPTKDDENKDGEKPADATPSETPGGNEVVGEEIVKTDPAPVDNNGKATVEVKPEEVTKAIAAAVEAVEKAKAEGKEDVVAEVTIVVKPEAPKDDETAKTVTVTEVELIVKTVNEIVAAHDVVLKIETDIGTIVIDNATLAGIVENHAEGETVTITATVVETPTTDADGKTTQPDTPKSEEAKLTDEQKDAVGENTVIDLTIKVGDKVIHEFKGEVIVQAPYTPPVELDEEDYDLLTVYYVAEDGTLTEIKGAYFDPKTKQIVFTTTHFSKFMVAEWISPFSDIKKGDWYYKSARYGNANIGIVGADGKFMPRVNSTRATMVQILANIAGIDTSGGELWYSKALAWGVENKITDGNYPANNITREQMFQMLFNYSGAEKVKADLSRYTDANLIHSWALDGMNWAVANGYVTGTTATTLSPTADITRAEVVVFLQKYLTTAK